MHASAAVCKPRNQTLHKDVHETHYDPTAYKDNIGTAFRLMMS